MIINRGKRCRPILFLILFVFILSSPHQIKAEQNLAPNPSFESNPYIDYRTFGNGTFSHVPEGLSDSMALKIERYEEDLGDEYGRWISETTRIEIPEEAGGFIYSVLLRGNNIGLDMARIQLNYWGEEGVDSYLGGEGLIMTPTGSWEQFTIQSSYIPPDAKYIRIEIRLLSTGALWADEAQLIALPEDDSDLPPDEINGTYYVAPNGDDNNSGAEQQPFRTIQYAIDLSEPGDTIVVREGTYVEEVSLTKSGIEENPISLVAYPNEKPIIDGAYELPPVPNSGWAKCNETVSPPTCFHYKPLVEIAASHIIIDGFEIRHSLGRGVWVHNEAYRVENIIIRNTEIHDHRNAGIKMLEADNVLFEFNRVWHSSNYATHTTAQGAS